MPHNPSLSPFTTKYGVNLIEAPARHAGPTTQYNMRDQGFAYTDIANFVIRRYGSQIHQGLKDFIEMLSPRIMQIGTTELRVKEGRDILFPGKTMTTLTANGVGLKEIEIEVCAEDGTAGRFFSVGQTIVALSGRNFRVTASSTSPGGFQTLTLKPKDAKQNLRVIGGQSLDFPNNTNFGHLSTFAKIDTSCPPDEMAQYSVFPNETVYKLMKIKTEFRRDAETLKNRPIGLDAYFYNEVNGKKLVDNSGNFIISYIDGLEMEQIYRFEHQKAFQLLYGEPDLDSDADIFGGGGFIPQIPREFRRGWTPSAFSLTNFRKVISDWRANNPNLASQSGQLHAWLGPASYEAITENIMITTPFQIQRRAEPSKTFEQARQGYVLGENCIGFTHAGYDVIFHQLPVIEERWHTGRRSPRYKNSSIRTHDILLIDQDLAANPDLITGDYKAESGVHKQQLFTRNDEYMQDNWTKGTTNPDGTLVQGEVYDMSDNLHRRIQCIIGTAHLEKDSMFYMTME